MPIFVAPTAFHRPPPIPTANWQQYAPLELAGTLMVVSSLSNTPHRRTSRRRLPDHSGFSYISIKTERSPKTWSRASKKRALAP